MKENQRVYEQVQDMRRLITAHPWEWLRGRGFVDLSVGNRQDERLAGNAKCRYWMIARLMSLLYDAMFGGVERMSIEESFAEGFLSVDDLLDAELGIKKDRIRLLSHALRASDGLGQGLWGNVSTGERCPITEEIRKFLHLWFPNYRTYGNEDEAIGLFGLEQDVDFFYAWLAWGELKKKNPRQCEVYVQRYAKWYRNFCDMRKQKWDGVLPEIVF